ncbi:hypothetical protein FRB98_005370 [Tulasnella sp. 332]|nr:hypothetical protein FRB98_005370 [Tulasnella sp. 332]
MLKSLQTENCLDKLVVLEGSTVTPAAYKRFFDRADLQVINIPGLFTRQVLTSVGTSGGLVSPVITAAPAQLPPVIGPPPGLPAPASKQSGKAEAGWETVRARPRSATGSSPKTFSSVAASAADIVQTPTTATNGHVTKHVLDRNKQFTHRLNPEAL